MVIDYPTTGRATPSRSPIHSGSKLHSRRRCGGALGSFRLPRHLRQRGDLGVHVACGVDVALRGMPASGGTPAGVPQPHLGDPAGNDFQLTTAIGAAPLSQSYSTTHRIPAPTRDTCQHIHLNHLPRTAGGPSPSRRPVRPRLSFGGGALGVSEQTTCEPFSRENVAWAGIPQTAHPG
jgi:hypothetical protein